MGQAGGTGPVRGGAGHAERGHRRDGVAIQVADVSFDEQDLADVRERQILRRGQHLDGAGGDPAMAAVIGVAAGIGAEDPTAGLGALGAFGDAGSYTNQGGVLTVFALDGVAKK